MNIIQTAVSQPDEIKPDRQRKFVIVLSDRSREIIRLFEELERKRHQQAEMNETKSRFVRSKRPFWSRFFVMRLPLFLRDRTSPATSAMSGKCQKRTIASAPAISAAAIPHAQSLLKLRSMVGQNRNCFGLLACRIGRTEHDLVFDFYGCACFLHPQENLERGWSGSDIVEMVRSLNLDRQHCFFPSPWTSAIHRRYDLASILWALRQPPVCCSSLVFSKIIRQHRPPLNWRH